MGTQMSDGMGIARGLAIVAMLSGLGVATPAVAGDGVYEINQACALAGCFPGDSPGFPVSAQTVGASYRLTGALTLPDANTYAISLAARASLDLAGFAISGPTSCTGTPAVCTGAGSGGGIGAGEGSTIRNGTIRGTGGFGISGDDGVRVENVTIESNGEDGIKGNFGSTGWHVAGCHIVRNGDDGIDFNAGSPRGNLVVNTHLYANTTYGIQGTGFALLGSIVDGNGSYGLNANMGNGLASFGQTTFYNNNGGNGNTQKLGGNSLGGNWCGTSAC
jgi:hypothetical protein